MTRPLTTARIPMRKTRLLSLSPFAARVLLALAGAGAPVLLAPPSAVAQTTTGRLSGRVTAPDGTTPVAGATVIAAGPQGEEAALTDDSGEFLIDPLTVGAYVLRVFPPGQTASVDRPGLEVSAGKMLRVNVGLPGAAAAEAVSETVVVRRKAPTIDYGSARTGFTLQEDQARNLPLGRTFGETLQLAPGAFVDRSGGVSIAGSSGLENTYVLNGLNVTGLRYGDLFNNQRDSAGGTNLPIEFVKELQVQTGGYSAEYGGAMGGVVNVVTKSGSNEFHGSVFSLWTPSAFIGSSRTAPNLNSVLVGRHVEGNDLNVGFEVGGPIIKNRLFFWAGFAPRFESGHFERKVLGLVDANGDGTADVDAQGTRVTNLLATSRTDEWRRSYSYGGKLTFLANPDNRFELSILGSPTQTRSIYRDPSAGPESVSDLHSSETRFHKNNTDIIGNWSSNLLDRSWKLEASAGLHLESFLKTSPFGDVLGRQQLEYHGASLWDLERTPGCQPVGGFDPCPVDNYKGGGLGYRQHSTGDREMLDLKSTHIFTGFGRNELSYGGHLEVNHLNLERNYSGPLGERQLLQIYPDQVVAWNFFSLPRGRYPYEFANDASPLAGPPFYRDQLTANVHSTSYAAFAQDTFAPIPNLRLSLGLRYERQTLFDYNGDRFAALDNWGPRVGAVWDPTNDGHSKVYAHYGRFYESVPLDLAARYFGGEGILQRYYATSSCPNPPSTWQGTGGETAGCSLNGAAPFNNGSLYPVQPRLRGQYHDEIVAGVQRDLWDDLVVGANFTHRWLGSIIEDGTAAPDFTFVLANPGNVPKEALDDVQRAIDRKQQEVTAATTDAEKALRGNELGALQAKLANLKGLANEPKPERTYTALTLTAAKRITKRLSLHASYTYSRLIGNYNGLYDPDNNYAAPNGNNSYDTPELVVNKRGPLANDRPHSARATGFYEIPVPQGSVILGSVFSVFSGVPRNYQSALLPGQQLIFLLPRGSAGRTPTITQVDARVGYRRELDKGMSLELFVEIFNVLNTRTPTLLDDDYTYDMAAAIRNGTRADLAYARNINGAPINVNPNFGKPIAFQAPIHGRLGLRLLF